MNLSTVILTALDEKSLVNFGPLTMPFTRLMYTTKPTFSEDHISATRG